MLGIDDNAFSDIISYLYLFTVFPNKSSCHDLAKQLSHFLFLFLFLFSFI